ncbi:MAG: hypothetical protein FJ091_22305, partial [Deltaproteobacteria bacterium]|nr:hypothetical protein [Deltaproteobacteria bacterium]
GAIVDFLTFGFFGEDAVRNLFSKIESFINPVIDTIKDVYYKVKDWIVNNVGIPKIDLGNWFGKDRSIGPWYPFKSNPKSAEDEISDRGGKKDEGAGAAPAGGLDPAAAAAAMGGVGFVDFGDGGDGTPGAAPSASTEAAAGGGVEAPTTSTPTPIPQSSMETAPAEGKSQFQREYDAEMAEKQRLGEERLKREIAEIESIDTGYESPARGATTPTRAPAPAPDRSRPAPAPVPTRPPLAEYHHVPTEQDIEIEKALSEGRELTPEQRKRIQEVAAERFRVRRGAAYKPPAAKAGASAPSVAQSSGGSAGAAPSESGTSASGDAGSAAGVTPTPAPSTVSSGASLDNASQQIAEQQRMESSADMGSTVNAPVTNNSQSATG